MLRKGAGSIINLSSGFSSIKGLHRYFYGATKGTVIGLTKALTATPFVTARLILRHSRSALRRCRNSRRRSFKYARTNLIE
jgi:hypothetical protein